MPVLAATAINVPDERWEMAVVNGETLYARCQGGAYVDLCMRESVVDLLDRASEDLDCTGLVICLDKKEADLGAPPLLLFNLCSDVGRTAEILHSLMYVGGNIISPKTTAYDNRSFVLVGIDV